MHKPAKSILLILCTLLLLGAASCRKATDKSAQNPAADGKPAAAEQKVDVPEQKQEQPDDSSFEVDQKVLEERGSTLTLPADWPASLPLPDGCTIVQAASRGDILVVEFSSDRKFAEIVATISANASAGGFKVREAHVDKFSQSRIYTNADRQLNTNVTDTDGKVYGSMSLQPGSENMQFSGSTQYSGEFELPAAWPSDILPVYQGAVLREMHVPLEKGGRLMLSAQSNDEEDAVVAWFDAELPKHGWSAGASETRNGFSIRRFTGNGYELVVSARTLDGLTDIQYEGTAL